MEVAHEHRKLSDGEIRIKRLERQLDRIGISKYVGRAKLASTVIKAVDDNDWESIKQVVGFTRASKEFTEFVMEHEPLARLRYNRDPLAHVVLNTPAGKKDKKLNSLAIQSSDAVLLSVDKSGYTLVTRLCEISQANAMRIIYKGDAYLLSSNSDNTTPAHSIARLWGELLPDLLLRKEVAGAGEGANKVLFVAYSRFPDKVKELAKNPIYMEVFNQVIDHTAMPYIPSRLAPAVMEIRALVSDIRPR
ncbi:MAG: hypothetical protein KGH66_00150 [Candidatus Micrarchaeota archaeon]|nr:hypothetical protein [Candidatus Micrarchaeota archaeon]